MGQLDRAATTSGGHPHTHGDDPYVVIVTGAQFGTIFGLPPGRELTLGSAPGVDATIDDVGIAPRHATLTGFGQEARLVDLGTATGTFVDGVRVTDVRLRDGSRFQLGDHTVLKFVSSSDVEAAYQRKLAVGALHEPLTGLYNRRHLVERLGAELGAAQRHGRALSVLSIDIDALRNVNAMHGPIAGDETLKMVAFVLQGTIRKEDVVARFAGEEFVVLARETGLAGARALGERMRRAVERSRTSFGGKVIAVTVSVGVVAIGPNALDAGSTAQDVLATTARALAAAKERGGNTVATSP